MGGGEDEIKAFHHSVPYIPHLIIISRSLSPNCVQMTISNYNDNFFLLGLLLTYDQGELAVSYR